MVRSDTEVCLESLVKACRSRGAQRVPDARVAIVVSGSAATREYIQRLGRVLRPKPGEAVLYELISRRTTEGKAAHRRNPSRI